MEKNFYKNAGKGMMDEGFGAVVTPTSARLMRGFAFWAVPDREIGGWVYARRLKTGRTLRFRYEFRCEQEGLIKSALHEIFASVEKLRLEGYAARRLRDDVASRRTEVATRHRLRMISRGLAQSTIEFTAAHGIPGENIQHSSSCWSCGTRVDASIDVRCMACRWVVCHNCLECLNTRTSQHRSFAAGTRTSQVRASAVRAPIAESNFDSTPPTFADLFEDENPMACKRCRHHRPGINDSGLCPSCVSFSAPSGAPQVDMQQLVENFGKPQPPAAGWTPPPAPSERRAARVCISDYLRKVRERSPEYKALLEKEAKTKEARKKARLDNLPAASDVFYPSSYRLADD